MEYISDVVTNISDEENEMLAKEIESVNSQSSSSMVTGSSIQDISNLFARQKGQTLINDYNVGRNDPCPCGSGLKFKKCCMNLGRYRTRHIK